MSSIKKQKPHFIVMEGLDGVGKTTTAKAFAEISGATFVPWLQEPFHSAIKQLWRLQSDGYSISKNSEHFMFLGALRHLSDKIDNLLNQGNDVVVDRYYHSTLAVHNPLARIFGESPVLIEHELLGFIKPDFCFQLKVDEKERLVRSRSVCGRQPSPVEILLSENAEFYTQVSENFHAQCISGKALPLFIDGLNPAEVVAKIREKINKS